jgi:uncharacterized membrane protein YfcA
VTDAEILAAIAVFAGAACHSAAGFGFTLVAAPLVAAALPPEEAVSTLLVLGLLTNTLTLLTEWRRPDPLWRESAKLRAWGTLGAVAGAFLLERLDTTAMQLLVTTTVIVTLASQHRAARRPLPPKGSDPLRRAPLAGLAAGVLTTTTTANGPPLLLHLLGRGLAPLRIRDTLGLLFVAFGLIGLAVMALGAASLTVPGGSFAVALAAAVAAGHFAGRPVFAILAERHYERVVALLLVVSVVAGAVVAVA